MTGTSGTTLLALFALALYTLTPLAAPAAGLDDRRITPKRAPLALRASAPAASAAHAGAWTHGERDLMQALALTGLDPARLLQGLLSSATGVGGPFEELGPDVVLPAAEMAALVERVRISVPLSSPVREPHRFTSQFGPRRDPFRTRGAFHRGIDIAAARGTPIYATAAGTVVRAGRHGAYGNLVEIDHGNGVQTIYAHLHEYHVRRGDVVEMGQRIGRMGRTGRTTGVHLHYEVVVDDRPVDPKPFLRAGQLLLARGG